DLEIANDERMLGVGSDAIHPFAEVDAVEADVAVDLVVVEADERDRADVDLPEAAVRLLDAQVRVEAAPLGRLEAEAVLAALGGDIAREGVPAVGPPEAGAVVGVEGQHLLGEPIGPSGGDGEIAVEDVEDLGAVLEEVAVAEALVTDAIADDEVVGAVDR